MNKHLRRLNDLIRSLRSRRRSVTHALTFRGKPLTAEDLRAAVDAAAKSFGKPAQMLVSPQVYQRIVGVPIVFAPKKKVTIPNLFDDPEFQRLNTALIPSEEKSVRYYVPKGRKPRFTFE